MHSEHEYVTKAAINALPAWAYSIIAPVKEDLVKVYSHNLDGGVVRNPSLKKYVAFYKDKLPLHYLPNTDTVEENFDRVFGGFLFYFKNMPECFAERRMNDGCLFAGMLLHFIQDACWFQHGMDSPCGFKEPGGCSPFPKLLQLFPPPKNRQHENAAMIWKRCFISSQKLQRDLANTSADNYSPQLLGLSPQEAAFNLYRCYWDMIYCVRGTLPEFFSSIYSRNEKKYLRICKNIMKNCAWRSADILYTALCIANKRFPKTQVSSLDKIRVESLVPLKRPSISCNLAYHDCPLVTDYNLDIKLKRHRLALLIKSKTGLRVKYFRHGLGTGMGWQEPEEQPNYNSCNYAIRYRIPAQVFSYFTVTCGVNAKMPHAGKISLAVHLNGKEKGSTGIISKPGPGKTIKVDIRSGGAIDLVARNEASNPKKPPFPQVNIVWADPILVK